MKRLFRFLFSLFRRRTRDDYTALLIAHLGLPR
jgi:hypothetical protein